MSISLILRLLSNISNIVLGLVGLRSFRAKVASYIRFFAFLNIYEEIAELVIWRSNGRIGVQLAMNDVVVVAELIVFSFAFYRILYSKTTRRLILAFLSIYLLYYGMLYFRHGLDSNIPAGFDLFPYLFLLIPSLMYFREIFIYQRDGDLLRDFTFWLVTGIMFHCVSILVNRVALGYLMYMNIGQPGNEFYLLFSFAFIIENIIFIKAFLCLKK
jgi:hypothetical protein